MKRVDTVVSRLIDQVDSAGPNVTMLVVPKDDVVAILEFVTVQREEFGELLAKNVDLERQVREKEQVIRMNERDSFF